jgi:hypothetical protein
VRARILAIGILPAVFAAAAAALLPVRDGGAWADGSTHGRWRTVFTGYGSVSGHDTAVQLTPRAPGADGATHAALVTTRTEYRDLALSLRLRTREQLRHDTPNPWEVGWVVWHYTDPGRFYALTLKPNGWELSKQDPEYPGGQRFLATGGTPVFPVSSWHDVGIVQVGNVIKVSAGGQLLASFTDTEQPYLAGSVGLYSEDARVSFADVRITALSTETKGTARP